MQVGAFDITIEQPEGSIRRGTDADGKLWESKMHNTYGYFRGTEGVDGDHIDVFLSNDMDGWNGAQVFVVDQYNPDGTFDEHKVMLGFNDASDAKNNYLANYEKGWENGRRIDVSAVNLEDFEKWIASSHRKTKPFSEYKSVKPADDSETFKGHKVENSGKDTEAQIKHLEEIKDYPGADKKIVQSEIDRQKAKEEAKAKSKSEEVKSKSKGIKSKSEEENGVDDAKIDAVLEALSKGDEKAEQLVQGLTSRELSKLRSKVKASPVLENEWLHRVRTRGDVSLHGWLLENQYVEPVKRVSGTFKMTDYTAPKNVHEGRLSGVYHDDKGYAVASDGIILVADKGSYDPKLKGKVIGKDGVAMENKFPDWQKVIPIAEKTKSSRIDAEDLHRFVAGVLKAGKHAYISLRFPDGTTAAFNAGKLNLMLRATKQLGTSELLYTKDGMMLVAKSDKGAALLIWRVSAEDELMEEYGYAYPGNKEKKNWLLTAYEKKNSASDNTTDTAETAMSGKRNDTSTPQNTVSMGKVNESPETKQEKNEKSAEDSQNKIIDVGEKISGARKDLLRDFSNKLKETTLESLITLPFSKAFKRPDLKTAVEQGLLRQRDARFAEAVMATYLSKNKPRLLSGWKKGESQKNLEAWAKDAYFGVQTLRALFEADETTRDKLIDEILSVKPYREDDIDRRKKQLEEWNPGEKFEGKCYPLNPVAVYMAVYERLGYDNIGEFKLPVSGVGSSTFFDHYELTDNSGKKIYPTRALQSFEDVVDEITYLSKVKNADEDTDHPNSIFRLAGINPVWESTGWQVLTLGTSSSKRPEKHLFMTKEEAEKFAEEYKAGGKYRQASTPIENKEFIGYGNYELKFHLGEKDISTGLTFSSKKDALAAIDTEHEKLNAIVNEKLAKARESGGKNEKRPQKDYVRIQAYTEDGKTWKYAVVLDERYAPKSTAFNTLPYSLANGFSTRKEAVAYIEKHRVEWDAKIDDINRRRKDFVFLNGSSERVGEDYRKGEDITAEQFREQFGFRGVQFGNWTNQKDRQAALNNAFDSFMDLAKILGISPRAVSLNGELGIAFGARGGGGAKAHYEREEVVINLTKTMGAGSLAHEWWHALDNYFARRGNVKLGMVTEGKGIAMRGELRKAYDKLVSDIENSDYNRRSRDAGASYWGTRREETARMFAMWVFDEISKKGERNSFLTDNDPAAEERYAKGNYDFYVLMCGQDRPPMTFEEFRKSPSALAGYVYPSQQELEEFGADLRKIFDTVQERVDEETGNTVLYHRGEVVSEMSQEERVLRDAVIDRLRESGMEVITDEEAGRRVLDEANGKAKLSAKKRRALETASLGKTPRSLTVVSSADGANVLKSIDTLVSEFEKSAVQPKTFIGDVAKALGAERGGSASEYASFETKNGKIITIRLSNHNAKVSNFDANGETDGISIVVSPKKSGGMTNDGKAHVVEYYYDAIKLRRAEGKPLADIVRSIKQALYSGEFEDTTGLAERQEVNAEITDRVRFFRTAKGEAYGFTVGGKIYIDPKIANTETPIHEYAHLWAAALRGQNPKEWQNIVELMKGTSVWDEVKKRYPELNTDNDIADEVLATYSGRRGAERLREEQRKIAGDKGGVFEKAEAISALERVKQALRKFWKSVADFLHIHYKSAEEVADRVMKDLLDGVDPGKHFNSRNGDPRFMFADTGESMSLESPKENFEKTKFRLLDADDPKAMELESLPESELVPVYRNVQAFEDDALGSPMAFTDAETGERRTLEGRRWNYSAPPKAELTEEQQRKLDEFNKKGYIMVDGKKSTELQINDGLKFVKPKTKEAQLQYFLKKNPEDKGLWAAYDPYDHAIETPLNTQFGEAYKRPNLVVVRSLIPKSEIDEPFHADYALLPTGAHQWNNGRTLYLSRWSKIDKVLTREEEAKLIDEYWKKHPGKREELKTHRDYNRFVPQVRRELEKMGYRFELDGKELTPEESLALDKQNWENRDIIPGREGHTPFVSNEDIARINAKMAGKWVGEPKEAMESAMSERVTELSERLHTPVRIIRTEEEVAALPSVRQRRMKGSFNPMTGEVFIVVPNNANMADVENTFVHEVVGHDGMRVLFPDEAKLNNALDELYRVSKDEIRGTIDRMAQKMYDAEVDRIREKKRKEHVANGEDANASYYADMAAAHAEAGKKREQFKRDATEEYGADLAGRIGEKGFEKMSAEELTFWGKLKAMLQKALQKLLDGLKIPGKRKWGDKDWAFVLHEAYKRKKNGGKPTVFDAADTEVMRRKTGFDETKFSDGKNKSSEPKPIGHSTFGSVYNQFKGKVLQAVKFLLNHESGDLLGVFHRNDVGDIDMVWGDEGGGLCHILNKHINDKDFPTVKDLVSRIEDIINKGEVDERHSNADKLVLVKNGYLVTIRRNVREKGIKIADKNWVLTAYNKDAPATTKAPVDGTYGSTAVAPGTSSDAKLATKSEINEFSDNNVADEGVMFRGGKELRDGRKIEFVRKPTATYNALARHLQAEGIKPDMHEARTGSRYMSFEKDGVQWEVRSSDHTKPEYYGEAQKPVELTYYKDKQGEENLSVSVDLGTSGYNIEDMKALMAEIGRLKNDAGEVKESFDKGVASDEVVERYPLLSQALGVMSENEVRAKEEAREHAEEARKQEMRSAVENLAGKLHLNNVDIVDKPAGRGSGRRERAKGMFERSTGRITINTGNCADKRDAVVTLLHEAVAHHGLRKLFGENFETFLDNVYNSANAEIRRIIDKHSSRYGGDKRTATEEYMASLAERTDFENAKKSGWWQRIKDFFLKMLEKIGLKGFKGEDLSDNELRYVLWRSYENLKSGGKDTVFSAADDLAKQSELKVGEFAPDAKKTAHDAKKIAPEENAEEVNERFNNELTRYQSGDMDKNEMLHLGKPQGVMKQFLPDLPIVVRQRILKKGSEKKHNIDVAALANMPRHLSSPIFVFQRSDNALGVLTEMQDRDGKNVCVAIELDREIQNGGEMLEVNDIRSVHGRNVADIVYPIVQNGTLKWADKEKGLAYLSSASRYVQQEIDKQVLNTAAKVVENFENPKSESENDALFRDGDAKDYEKAQARETYEYRVSTGMFQSREAIQDSMLSLKVAMDAIEEATAGKAKRIEDYDGFENAYLGENRLSSANQAESAAFAHQLIRPMMEEVNRLAPTAEDRAELIDYMFAKHGLERNAYMRQQAAEKKLAEYKKQNPGTAKTAADFIDAERDYAGLTTLTGEADVSAAEAEAQRMVADYENEHNTFHGTWNEIYVCRKKIC